MINWFRKKSPVVAALAQDSEDGYTVMHAFVGNVLITEHRCSDGAPLMRITMDPEAARIMAARLIAVANEIDAA